MLPCRKPNRHLRFVEDLQVFRATIQVLDQRLGGDGIGIGVLSHDVGLTLKLALKLTLKFGVELTLTWSRDGIVSRDVERVGRGSWSNGDFQGIKIYSRGRRGAEIR